MFKPVRARKKARRKKGLEGSEGEWMYFESSRAAARELGISNGSGGISAAVNVMWKMADDNRTQAGHSWAGLTFEWVKFVENPGEVWKDVTVEVLNRLRGVTLTIMSSLRTKFHVISGAPSACTGVSCGQ
mmetsp:Transcript_18670/g.43531  ORF Transcript_18670/g.43531 Transcript_18670/m.43531 type:complete len:130 (+) Transcript_18670:224-613(+)